MGSDLILSGHFWRRVPERLNFRRLEATQVASIINQCVSAVENNSPLRYEGCGGRQVYPATIQFFSVEADGTKWLSRHVHIITSPDGKTLITLIPPAYITNAARGKAKLEGLMNHA